MDAKHFMNEMLMEHNEEIEFLEEWIIGNELSMNFTNIVQEDLDDLDAELNSLEERIIGLWLFIQNVKFELEEGAIESVTSNQKGKHSNLFWVRVLCALENRKMVRRDKMGVS